MFRNSLQILSLILIVVLWQGCAQMTPLNGGERDTTAPKLVKATPQNLQSNFKSRTIELLFNEYIQLKDLNNQLLISPKLKNIPEIVSEGKTVKIFLETDQLEPNTTYRFYFGQAIVDMNESNPVNNFAYIFSTGDFIDSLKISGKVKNAWNNLPVENALIGLYMHSLQNDSLPYQVVPNYITRTDGAGEFSIGHLPAQTFRTYAITDANKNLMYDPEVEMVGFQDTKLVLSKDTAINFTLFKEEPSKIFVKKTISPYYGLSRIILNKKTKVKLSSLHSELTPYIYVPQPELKKDTLLVYYHNISDSLDLVLRYDENKRVDTVNLRLAKKNTKRRKFGFISLNTVSNSIPLYQSLQIAFINWMDTAKTDLRKMKLTGKRDSITENINLQAHWSDLTHLQVDSKLKEGMSYLLVLDTNAFYDINNLGNDSTRFNFNLQNKNEFGKVTLKMVLYKKQQYIIQLIDEKEQVLREEIVSFSLSSSNTKTLVFTDVPPGVYRCRIVFDDNENNRWDSGNLFLKQQAEPVNINSKLLKVISDWEIEEEIVVKE